MSEPPNKVRFTPGERVRVCGLALVVAIAGVAELAFADVAVYLAGIVVDAAAIIGILLLARSAVRRSRR